MWPLGAVVSYAIVFGYLLVLSSAQNLISELKANGIDLAAPGDARYANAAAPYNDRFTFHPAAVTFPTTPGQVTTIVQTAVQYDTRVSARSGGHSYIANSIGGRNGVIVIDLNRHLTSIVVDDTSGQATIQSGSRLGDIALTLNDHGRGFGHGTCPYVGIGGHASFGGFAFSSRQWGMALDAIVSMNLVLANGTVVTASKTENTELFWGMRGAGPSFGITTSITFNTFPVPPSATVFLYTWNFTASKAASFLDFYQSFSLGKVPSQFGSELILTKGSGKGRVTATYHGVWFGNNSCFNDVIDPLLKQINQNPESRYVQPGTYIDSVAFFGDQDGRLNTTGVPDQPQTFYVKSLLTPESQPISSKSTLAFMRYLANEGFHTDLNWAVDVEEFGGPGSAVNAVPLNATSFGNRNALFLIQFYAYTSDVQNGFPSSGFALVDGMVNSILNRMPSNWPYSAYPNYLDDRLQSCGLKDRYHQPAFTQLWLRATSLFWSKLRATPAIEEIRRSKRYVPIPHIDRIAVGYWTRNCFHMAHYEKIVELLYAQTDRARKNRYIDLFEQLIKVR